jgi:hypothetical protein
MVSSPCDEVGNAHMLLSLKVLSANRCAWSFYAAVCLFLQQGKVWMLQLLSVACMSLAAKMEETEVPILVDLQVESYTVCRFIARGFVFSEQITMQCGYDD